MLNLNPLNPEIWDKHYKKDISTLQYPDENLVRILSKLKLEGTALDHGSGSGRHIKLLKEFGFAVSACDYSKESILKINSLYPDVQTHWIGESSLPYQNKTFDVIVSWGVLHYNDWEDAQKIILELKRILKKGGYLIGSIRSSKDTHLKTKDQIVNLQDIKGSKVKLYEFEEVKLLLQNFEQVQYAYMERSVIGNLEERICHWIFQAKN